MLRRIVPESLTNIRVSTTDGPVKALNKIFFFALLFYLKKENKRINIG